MNAKAVSPIGLDSQYDVSHYCQGLYNLIKGLDC